MRTPHPRPTRTSRWLAPLLAFLVLVCAPAAPALAQTELTDEVLRAEEVLERTDEVLGRVADAVREADIPKSRELLDNAYQMEKQAHRIFGEITDSSPRLVTKARLRQSVSLSLRARDLGLRAGRHLREQVTLQRQAQRELDRLREHFLRLRERAGGEVGGETADALARVRSQLERAERQLRDGNFEVALRYLQTADHLMRNLDVDRGADPLADRYRQELERARQQSARLREELGGSDAVRRLDQVEEMLDRSESRFQAGQLRLAGRLLEEARQVLGDLRGDASLPPSAGEIRRAMERVEGALRDLEEAIDASAPTNVRRMLSRARDEHRRTLLALEEERLEAAVRHHRITVDLVTRLRSWVDEQSF